MKSALAMLLSTVALCGCFIDDPLPPAPAPTTTVLAGDLDLDIRDRAHVEVTTTGAEVTVSLALGKGFGVAPVSTTIRAAGRVEAFPEADLALYTARFDAPADPSGPCGAEPVSLALSLRRRGKDAHVGGSLTAYCGAATWHGTPTRLLRLAGDLPLP